MTARQYGYRIVEACALYAVTWTYTAGVVVILGIAEGVVSVGTGLVILSTLTILIALISTRREVKKVHARIEQLTKALQEAGVRVPATPARELRE